jgi:hypothetical protein
MVHLGAIGVQEERDVEINLKVAGSLVGVDDPDKVKERIETAIANHLVPATCTRDIATIVLDEGTMIAVNIEPSPGLVSVWDRAKHLIQYVRRTSHGKQYLNPDEVERLMSNGPRGRMLRLRQTVARAAAGSASAVHISSPLSRQATDNSGLEPWQPPVPILLGVIAEEFFEIVFPLIGG